MIYIYFSYKTPHYQKNKNKLNGYFYKIVKDQYLIKILVIKKVILFFLIIINHKNLFNNYFLILSAFPTTKSDEKLIAAEAIMGVRCMPGTAPAAIGIQIAL